MNTCLAAFVAFNILAKQGTSAARSQARLLPMTPTEESCNTEYEHLLYVLLASYSSHTALQELAST